MIGAVLIVLGVIGVVKGNQFVFDPGQERDSAEAYYYLIMGVVMIVNGLVTPPPVPEDADDTDASRRNVDGVSTGRRPDSKGTGRMVKVVAEKSPRE